MAQVKVGLIKATVWLDAAHVWPSGIFRPENWSAPIIVSCSQLTRIQTPLAGEAAAAVLGAATSRFHLAPGGE